MSFEEIQRELKLRSRRADTLRRKRDRLARRIAGLDDRIREMGGGANGVVRHRGSGGRPANERTLPAALQEVLKGKEMRVTDAAVAVQKAGYKTNSKTFRVQVNIALVKRKDLFKRVGRGVYTAK